MKSIRIYLVVAFLSAIIGFSSCKSDSPTPNTGGTGGSGVTVKFTSSKATYAENIGTENIAITLSAAQTTDVIVKYTWTSSDTLTFLGGDFSFGTPTALQVTIPSGQTTANIPVKIIDDTQIDGDDDVAITLASADNNVSVSSTASENTFDLTITDNDVAPVTDLQLDLVWFLTGKRSVDINGVNMDFFLQYGVVYNQTDGIQDIGITYDSSKNATGFETMTVKADAPDSVYWMAAAYIKGTAAVNFFVTLNGFDQEYVQQYGFANFAAGTTAGQAIFFGPFEKTGSTFPFTGRSGITPASPDGKIHIFKVNHFRKG